MVANAPIPVVFCTTICDDAVTHPGYCAELDTVSAGRNALTWVELLTKFAVNADVAKLAVPNNEPVIPPISPSLINRNEPVIIADPLNGNPTPDPAFNANEDVVANDAVDGIKVILVAALAVVANDAEVPINALNCAEDDITPLNLLVIAL